MKKGEAIEHRMVTNAIEKSQRKVEGRNFDMRKTLLSTMTWSTISVR